MAEPGRKRPPYGRTGILRGAIDGVRPVAAIGGPAPADRCAAKDFALHPASLDNKNPAQKKEGSGAIELEHDDVGGEPSSG